MKDLSSINDYFNIAKSSEMVQDFFILARKLAYFPDKFTRDEAARLLYIIDNERENLKLMAEAFIRLGENVQVIPDENWSKLRNTVLTYL